MRLRLLLTFIIISITLVSYGCSMDYISAESIQEKIQNKFPVHYQGVKIYGDLDLTRTPTNVIDSDIVINDSQILGSMIFRGATFQKRVEISNTSFSEKPNFVGVLFNEPVDFSYSKFKFGTNFDKSKFKKICKFHYTEFDDVATFTNAEFNTSIFNFVSFNADSTFEQAFFEEGPIFADANFYKGSNFIAAKFRKGASFNRAYFDEVLTLRGALLSGTIDFDHAKTNGVTFLSNAELAGNLNLTNMHINTLNAKDIKFTKAARISLEGSEFETIFMDFSLDKIIYDRNTYSSLVNNFKKQGDFIAADDCYYQLRNLDNNNRNFFLDYSYGYGVRPLRAIFWCIVFIFSFGVIYRIAYRPKEKRLELIEAIYVSTLVFALHHLHDSNCCSRWKYVFLIESLLGWLFLALFLASLIRSPL